MSRRFKRSEAREYRAAARDAWIKSGGSLNAAEAAFKADPRIAKLDPLTIIALIQISIKIWLWWRSRQLSEPSVVASEQEPTFGDDDE